jgi:hypothetical protein
VVLVIVARREESLYRYLSARFAGITGVEVILERRHAERRRQQIPRDSERRAGADRRRHRGEPHRFGFTLLRL